VAGPRQAVGAWHGSSGVIHRPSVERAFPLQWRPGPGV